MNLNFKKATITDVALIADLADKIWRIHYPSIITIEQINYMLDKMYSANNLAQQMNEGQEFTIAYDSTIPVGYIAVSKKSEGHYFLHKLYVDTSQHRKGIGEKIWTHVESQLLKPCKIELTVNRSNFKALNFYFKKGFVIDHIADFDIGNGFFMNDFVMVKKLLVSGS